MSVSDAVPSLECLNCGYDLASGPGGVLVTCPECGAPAPERRHEEWRDKVARLGLTLALWGIPVFGLAGLSSRRSLGSINISNTGSVSNSTTGSGSWSLSSSLQGFLEFASVAMVIIGVVCLQRSSTGRRATGWLLGGAALLALLEFGTTVQSSTVYPWTVFGMAQNSWPDRIRDWATTGAYAAVGAVLMHRVSSLLRHTGLPVMSRWGPRVAIVVVIVGVVSPAVEWIGREIWAEWTASSQAMMRQSVNRAGTPRGTFVVPGPAPQTPWYARSNAVVLVFWTAPLKAGVLAAMWGFVVVARMRLAHMTGGRSRTGA